MMPLLIFVGVAGLTLNLAVVPLVWLVCSLWRARVAPAEGKSLQSVTVIIPAFNEAARIGAKLDNLECALEPIGGKKVEVIIGSDGSTDNTHIEAGRWIESRGKRSWSVRNYVNQGKCQTINQMVAESSGEVIISTDADVDMPMLALQELLSRFEQDSRIGCVSSVPAFSSAEVGHHRHYWNFELRTRQVESRAGLLIVATGWLYGFRREAFQEVPRGVMADDLWIPLVALLRGYRSVQLDNLVVQSEKTDEETEARRRRRVIAGGMDVVRRVGRRLLKRPEVLALVLAHKVNRWAIPLYLALILLGTAAIEPWLMMAYALAALAALAILGKRSFFVLMETILAPLGALIAVIRARDLARWGHTRVG